MRQECLISTYTPCIHSTDVIDYALHEIILKMTMNMDKWHIALIFEDTASTKCLSRQGKVLVSHASLHESSAVH